MIYQFSTLPGRENRANEDYVGALPGCAVLLDGAGGPSELPTGCSHGTAWFVEQLGARLLVGMVTDPGQPLQEIFAKCIRNVAHKHKWLCDLTAPGTPASTVIMTRLTQWRLDYLVLGDSTLVIDRKGELGILTDRRIDEVATAEHKKMDTLPTGSPEHQEARLAFVTRQRELRNRPDGYPIASTEPAAGTEAVIGSAPLEEVRRVTLLSDGVTRYVEFNLGSWEELLGTLDIYGPSAIFSRIREAESMDPDGKRWPRAKHRDDVGVVHISPHGRDGYGHLDLATWKDNLDESNGTVRPVPAAVPTAARPIAS